MIVYPSKHQYAGLAREGYFFPFLAELHTGLNPAELYAALAQRGEFSLVLESSRSHPALGRYSFVLTNPIARFRSYGDRCLVCRTTSVAHGHPFGVLRELFGEFRLIREENLPPFVGGMAGLLNYELKNQIERFKTKVEDPYGLPDIDLGLFDRGVVYDHAANKVYAFLIHKTSKSLSRSFKDGMKACLAWAYPDRTPSAGAPSGRVSRTPPGRVDCLTQRTAFGTPDLEAQIRRNRVKYETMVREAKRHIRRGDIYQANLSHTLKFDIQGDAFELYKKQREVNPTSFAGFADFGDYELMCGSPERLVSLKDGVVSTRPIAGTRPRSLNRDLDRQYREDLLLSPKERAEHIMLVDLERNDLGKVCETGTVRVDELMTVEEYSHVRHIVSDIKGVLSPEKDVFDLIAAVFPGGTITGTPKIRSMEIIGELEGKTRGAYTGSLGYIGFDGDCDLNIVIRSLLIKNCNAFLSVGAGIVADSKPSKEYGETLDKAKAILQILRSAVEAKGPGVPAA